VIRAIREGRLGRIIDVEAGFLHSSDLDPEKPINWKRRTATCGEYGVMGDLGLHVVHIPARFGWVPTSVHAVLSKIVAERPDGKGGRAPCETWDNARLTCRVAGEHGEFPLVLRMERIAPGETDTWFITVRGTAMSASFTTKHPRTFRWMEYQHGKEQSWQSVDVGYDSVFKGITGSIFEFGFSDAILQMWAAFVNELAGHEVAFGCATPAEAHLSHRLFTAALASQGHRAEVRVG
jgi:predicted dehydrogenase